MTFAQVIQLYAPLAGLLVVVFWLGVLSNRVLVLEREAKERKDADGKRDDGETNVSERLVKLETTVELKMQNLETELKHIAREFGGVQRQLANLSAKSGKLVEFTADHS